MKGLAQAVKSGATVTGLIGLITLGVGAAIFALTHLYLNAFHRGRDPICAAGQQVEACKTAFDLGSLSTIAVLLAVFGFVLLSVPSVWPAIKRSRDMLATNEPERAKPVSLSLRLWYLPVTATLFFAFAYVLGTSHNETVRFFKEISFAIATAFLVSWGFSGLLDLPHISEYILEKLAHLLLGDDYLRSITPSLPLLRKRIDRVLYGEAATNYPWSFYAFISGELEDLFRSSFRRNFSVQITCTRQPDCASVHWKEVTRYQYVRSSLDQKPAVIPVISERNLQGEELRQALENKHEFHNSRMRGLSVIVGGVRFRPLAADYLKLVAEDNREIPVKVELEGTTLRYIMSYEIPEQALAAQRATDRLTVPCVDVEIIEEFVQLGRDDVYYLSMSLPTEDFTLYCSFPEGVRLEFLRFRLRDGGAQESEPEPIGHGMATINGWLMPGHGVCVGWFGLAPAKRTSAHPGAVTATHGGNGRTPPPSPTEAADGEPTGNRDSGGNPAPAA